MSQDQKTFEGQCYCGAVRIVVTGDPVGAGYCHCASCRQWAAALDNAAAKRGLNLVWFSTGKDDFLLTTTRDTVDLLKNGNLVLMAPEGTRESAMIEGKDGMTYVAIKANAGTAPQSANGQLVAGTKSAERHASSHATRPTANQSAGTC